MMSKRNRKERGSVMVFAVIIMSAMGSMLLPVMDVATAARKKQNRVETETKEQYVHEGAVRLVDAMLAESQPLPYDFGVDLAGYGVSIRAKNAPSDPYRYVNVEFTRIRGAETKTESFVMGSRRSPHPFFYAARIGANSSNNSTYTFRGPTYVETGLETATTTFNITDDAESTGLIPTRAGLTIGQAKRENVPPVPMPDLDPAVYAAAADVNVTSLTLVLTLAANLFPKSGRGLAYSNSNLTVAGSLTGNHTIFVNGNLTISGAVRPILLTQPLVFLVTGDVIYTSGGTSNAFIYCKGRVRRTGGFGPPKILNGNLATEQLAMNNDGLEVRYDRYFFDDPSRLWEFKVPGFWPSQPSL